MSRAFAFVGRRFDLTPFSGVTPFSGAESCLRLIRALAVEIHEDWLETHRYLNMEAVAEQKKSQLHGLELAAA